MSIDDYFMQESEVEEKDPTTGKIVCTNFVFLKTSNLHILV